MKLVNPSFEILDEIDRIKILKKLELCGRVCYKSEQNITEDSAAKFVRSIIKSGHESVIEHVNLTVKFICDRGVSHELVRHRLASYSQESTRYCNYGNNKFGNEITCVKPSWYDDNLKLACEMWDDAMDYAEKQYLLMLKYGVTPQDARAVLPNSLKTEIIVTANLREYRHILNLRCSSKAHPDIRILMLGLLRELNCVLPEIFGDIAEKYLKNNG